MKVEKGHSGLYHLILSSYELSALISATRVVAEGTDNELDEGAKYHLKQVLKSYDDSVSRLNKKSKAKNLPNDN